MTIIITLFALNPNNVISSFPSSNEKFVKIGTRRWKVSWSIKLMIWILEVTNTKGNASRMTSKIIFQKLSGRSGRPSSINSIIPLWSRNILYAKYKNAMTAPTKAANVECATATTNPPWMTRITKYVNPNIYKIRTTCSHN